MNGSAKCRRGGLGWLGGTQGHGQCYHSIERTASYLLKASDFNLPHQHLVPLLGVTLVEFC